MARVKTRYTKHDKNHHFTSYYVEHISRYESEYITPGTLMKKMGIVGSKGSSGTRVLSASNCFHFHVVFFGGKLPNDRMVFQLLRLAPPPVGNP